MSVKLFWRSFHVSCITIDEIKLALRKTKNNKAPAEDNVVADTIKIGGPRLLKKITVLFNLCIYNQINDTMLL